MKNIKEIAQEIVDAINKTTNDYDAVDITEKIITEHFVEVEVDKTVENER